MRSRKGFLLNRNTGTLHRLPSFEQCNVDAISRKDRIFSKSRWVGIRFRKYCRICFPDGTPKGNVPKRLIKQR